MKHVFLILAIISIAACSKEAPKVPRVDALCQDQRSLSNSAGNEDYLCLIPQTKREALAIYFMSNDCSGCGSWGTKLFHDILHENKGKVNPMQVHIKYTDPWIIPGFADSMVARYSPNYTPFNMIENLPLTGRFQVNADPEAAKAAAAKEIANLVADNPEVSPALNYRILGDKIEIHYGARFESQLEGEYRMGLYVVEDDLEWNQYGSSVRPYYHDNTIRAAAGGAYGPQLLNGSAPEGHVVLGKISTEKIGWWKEDDLYLLGVVWKRDEQGRMQIVNSVVFRR